MLRDSMRYAEQDVQARMLAEQQVEADRVLESVEQALAADGEQLLSAAEREVIEAALGALRFARAGDDGEAIKLAIEQADRATSTFAARRMDASIRLALTGQQIDKV